MKKAFFLSMLLTACLVSSAFAFDDGAWDLEERIYLGEFPLGKAELTSEMSRGILRLGGLPDGRFVRVSVRTNRAGNVDLNTQLVEKREQTVISALRRIIPVTKLPEANVEVVTSRYDQDGVDAQGAWIEVYRPKHTAYSQWGVSGQLDDQNAVIKHKEPGERVASWKVTNILIVVLFFVGICVIGMAISKRKKTPKIRKDRLLSIRNKPLPDCSKTKPDVEANFKFEDVEINCVGIKNSDGTIRTYYDNGINNVFATANEKRWRKSVETSIRQWLYGMDVDDKGSLRDFTHVGHAVLRGEITRVK